MSVLNSSKIQLPPKMYTQSMPKKQVRALLRGVYRVNETTLAPDGHYKVWTVVGQKGKHAAKEI